MQICQTVYQIKIPFSVTPTIHRFVYVYVIIGKYVYLIDTGVAGSEIVIEKFLQSHDRQITDINGIFLTHCHPDHIGAAYTLKEKSGAKVYACNETKEWAEDIDLQYKKRPIPNFYTLVNQSVIIDSLITDNSIILLEEGITLQTIHTPGHSPDSYSLHLLEENILFIGDALPVKGEIPIYVNKKQVLESLQRILDISNISLYCPAWDRIYTPKEILSIVLDAKSMIEKIDSYITTHGKDLDSNYLTLLCIELEIAEGQQNPLFIKTIESHL